MQRRAYLCTENQGCAVCAMGHRVSVLCPHGVFLLSAFVLRMESPFVLLWLWVLLLAFSQKHKPYAGSVLSSQHVTGANSRV